MKVSRLLAVAVAVALGLAVAGAAKADIQVFDEQTVGLEQLLAPEGSIQVGDKIFTDFSFISHGDILAGDLLVTPILDSFGYGLRFSSESMYARGEQINGFVLQFDVSIAPGSNQLISDVHLRYNGANIGDGFSEVVETAIDPNTDNVLGQTQVNNPPPILSAGFDLATPLSRITIVKDVRINGDIGHRLLSDNQAAISWIDQSFSQVPEPSAGLLVAAGLFGVVMTLRRRR